MTYSYPKTIKEAAELLDSAAPGWARKINIDILDMNLPDKCILGQVYGNCCNIFDQLFGFRPYRSDYYLDCIFGSKANKDKWVEQINSRLNVSKVANDWKWAVEQMRSGNKVRRKNWDKKAFIYSFQNNIKLCSNLAFDLCGNNVDCTLANDWELFVDKIRLNDLKVGQKFKLGGGVERYYTKLDNTHAEVSKFKVNYIGPSFKLYGSNDDDEVTLVDDNDK
jgi:hypothetical protein